ncbi:Tctex1 domain-containing protein 4, partial [Operophtera brumata]
MSEPEERKSKVMLSAKSQSRTRSIANFSQRSMSRLRLRKPSYGFGGVPGIKPMERTSQLAIEFKRPPLLFLNTYQLDPSTRFHVPTVTQAANEVLDEHFTGHKYNGQESPAIAVRIAGDLMRRIKAMSFNRYRVIVVVTIGQKRAQSYINSISFLWDHERDNFVDVQRELPTVFIQ